MNWAPVAIIVSIVSIVINIGGVGLVAWITQKAKADAAELYNRIVEKIHNELDDYVAKQQFKDYVEAHGRDHVRLEKEITEFMTRHRDWKHDMEPWSRGVDLKIDDLQKAEELRRTRTEA